MLDAIKATLISVAVFVFAGGLFYACEILPMEECMGEGHSFVYCQKLLNK